MLFTTLKQHPLFSFSVPLIGVTNWY